MAGEPKSNCEFDGKKLLLKLDLTIPAEASAISPVVDAVLELVGQLQCSEGKEVEIETALREALANAIIHGCKRDASKKVQCCIAVDENKSIIMIVRDPGKGFDPSSLPCPVVGEHIYSDHGRGIYLINHLMDEVQFKQGGSEIQMVKH